MSERPTYDVVVVGARCAGSATAMLLARQGHRVLLIDRVELPADTLSTHIVFQSGVERLHRWGLEEAIRASGCPPIFDVVLDADPLILAGRPRPVRDVGHAYCVRRTVLDRILLDGATAAGAEVRLGTAVTGVLRDDAGVVIGVQLGDEEVHARLVIGADGAGSRIAKAVDADEYATHAPLTCVYYSYFSGMGVSEMRLHERPGRAFGYGPTNDGLTLALVIAPVAEHPQIRADVEGSFYAAFDLAPEAGELLRGARREDRFHGTADLPNFVRVPHGPGWALVGDAGCHKDPYTAQGISDAFRDAELLADAVGPALLVDEPLDAALAERHRLRDEALLPMYEYTIEMASMQEPADDVVALLMALAEQPDAIAEFLGLYAGSVRFEDFFAEENVARIIGAAARVGA